MGTALSLLVHTQPTQSQLYGDSYRTKVDADRGQYLCQVEFIVKQTVKQVQRYAYVFGRTDQTLAVFILKSTSVICVLHRLLDWIMSYETGLLSDIELMVYIKSLVYCS